MKKEKPIGIFDSGIGGVTVFREIIKLLPNEKYIYYSDSKNNPYGDKTHAEIIDICDNIAKYLIGRGCKVIVIACNTASAITKDFLREKYKDIPIVAIEPAYKMVHDYSYDEPTLVMATKGTIESDKFKKLYHKYDNHKTIIYPSVGLADIVENGTPKELEEYLEKNIGKYRGKVKDVVLGCTHYVLVKDQINKALGGNITFYDGSKGLAINLKNILEEKDLLNTENHENMENIEFIDSQKSVEKKNRFFEILSKIK